MDRDLLAEIFPDPDETIILRPTSKSRQQTYTYLIDGRKAFIEKDGYCEWSGWFEDTPGSEYIGINRKDVLEQMGETYERQP